VTVNDGDKLAVRLVKVGKHLRGTRKIDHKQLGVLTKFQHSDKLVSADTLNRYVPSFVCRAPRLNAGQLGERHLSCLQA
jgi:hypothetical protein